MANKRVGKFPKVFRQMAVDRLTQCENIVELAKELGIHRRLLYRWAGSSSPLPSQRGVSALFGGADYRKHGWPSPESWRYCDITSGSPRHRSVPRRAKRDTRRQDW